MARSTHLFKSTEEAQSFIRKTVKTCREKNIKVYYCLFIKAWLPTEENKGFEGFGSVSVSKDDFIRVIKQVCGKTLFERGAKLQLTVNLPETGEYGLAFIYLD